MTGRKKYAILQQSKELSENGGKAAAAGFLGALDSTRVQAARTLTIEKWKAELELEGVSTFLVPVQFRVCASRRVVICEYKP